MGGTYQKQEAISKDQVNILDRNNIIVTMRNAKNEKDSQMVRTDTYISELQDPIEQLSQNVAGKKGVKIEEKSQGVAKIEVKVPMSES